MWAWRASTVYPQTFHHESLTHNFLEGVPEIFPTALGSKFLVFLEKQNPKQNPVEIE
jgi:hypothetical protein